jgi:diguanylate cyclase (GGDEF)-like protein
MPGLLSRWRFSSRVLLPIVLAGAATALLLAAVLLLAARESDRIASERQRRLVSHVLAEQLAKLTHDQESVTIWDDAVRKTTVDFDARWIEVNLGLRLYEYFGHDRAYVLNANDRPLYAMVDGVSVEPSSYTTTRTALDPLVRQLREGLRAGSFNDSEESPHVFNLVMIEARPAMASVSPIVSDSGQIHQTPGTENFHVAVRFLDGTFLKALMGQYLLEGARFAWNHDVQPTEAAFPLARNSGAVLGYFVWLPERPGWRLLTRIGPALIGALLLIASIVALLARRLRRASRELEASEAQAQHLAFHDPLTGLANRALFNDRLDRTLGEARRKSSRVALLYLDLDRFKNVNDTLGHPAGDDLIRELSQRLTGLVRGSDCVARLGGDEFAILQTGSIALDDVAALCERIIEAVAQPFELLGNSAFVGVSIGVAIAPEAGIDRAELVRKADIALYRAKLEGRNRFRIFCDEMDIFVQRRRAIERELREALASKDQFEVVYQPLYSADETRPVGVEALLRWNHPEHGTIAPGTFIPIAEESGLVHEIGEWVLAEACKAAIRWPVRRVAVNVSPVQFRSSIFAATVLGILEQTGLEPSRLELEITESVLLDISEMSTRTVATLRAAGVRIALDDFGTGYSSLSYLHKYPVDKIKIDRSFVQNLDTDVASDAIVQAMVDLARAIGVEVTAEGVETEEQRAFLAGIGCNELQGFLLSRPLPAAQIDRILGMHDALKPPAVATAA